MTAPMRVAGGAAATPVEEALVLTGKLYRGEQDGAVRGWLFDHKTGFRIEFSGARDPRREGGYLIVGKKVPV